MDTPSNVKIIEADESDNDLDKFKFYTYGMTKAMKALGTSWKLALHSDEFITRRIDTSHFNRFLVYPLGFIQLYGNIETEIKGAFMEYSYRIHYGNRKLTGDGGINPPYSGKIKPIGIV